MEDLAYKNLIMNPFQIFPIPPNEFSFYFSFLGFLAWSIQGNEEKALRTSIV